MILSFGAKIWARLWKQYDRRHFKSEGFLGKHLVDQRDLTQWTALSTFILATRIRLLKLIFSSAWKNETTRKPIEDSHKLQNNRHPNRITHKSGEKRKISEEEK